MSSVDAKNKAAGADKKEAAVSRFKVSFNCSVSNLPVPSRRCQFACSEKSACNCMSPKVITFNRKFHQINKLIYVSLFGFEQASRHSQRCSESGSEAPAVLAKQRQGTSLATNFGIPGLSEAKEKERFWNRRAPESEG